MSGYYEPEWNECNLCSYAWHYKDKNWFKRMACEYYNEGFYGRVSPWKWFKHKIGCDGSFCIFLKCKLGIHTYFEIDKDEYVCCVCWRHKESEVP